MTLSKRAEDVSEKEQIILNGIHALEQNLKKNKEEKKELINRVNILTNALKTVQTAAERYKEDPELAAPQYKRIEKFEAEIKERNENIENLNPVIKSLEQRILQLTQALKEATEQKSKIIEKPKEEVTEEIPKKETIETEEIEIKEDDVSETERFFAIAAERQESLEKELNFSALQQAEEQARMAHKLAERRLEDCLEGFNDEDIDEEEEDFENETLEELQEETNADVNCSELEQKLNVAKIKLEEAERQLAKATAIIAKQNQIQDIKIKFTHENTKLQQIRTDINYMQEKLDNMDSSKEREEFIILHIKKIEKYYEIINAIFKSKTTYYIEKAEEERGQEQIVDRDKYDRTRQDILLLMYQLNEVVPQQRLIDQLMGWRKTMVVEGAPENDPLYRKLMIFLGNFEKLGIDLTKFIEKLRKREKKIGQSIESEDFLLWEEIKKDPIKLDTRGAIVVDTPMQFIVRFDKRFEQKIYKRFYFSDKFVSDPDNIESVIEFLNAYYRNLPIYNIEELFRVPRGTAAAMLKIDNKKWRKIQSSLSPILSSSNAEIIKNLQKNHKKTFDRLVKIYEASEKPVEELEEVSPDDYLDSLVKILKSVNAKLYKKLAGMQTKESGISILGAIAKKFGIDETLLEGREDKGGIGLKPILERMFAYNPKIAANIDPDDPYYYFVDGEKGEGGKDRQRRRLIFRGLDTSLEGYIRLSLRYAAIKMAKPKGGLGRSINCPLYNCNGKIYFELPDPGEKTFRSALHDWSYGGGAAKENRGFSKCDTCNWVFANQFINCPNCNLAVPLSSTVDSWLKLKPDTWLGKDSLTIEGKSIPKETIISQLIDSIKPTVASAVKIHNKNRYVKVKEFRAALRDHVEILKESEDEQTQDRLQKAIQINEVIDFIGIKELDPAMMIQEFFSEDTSYASLHQEFSKIWALFTNRRLGVRTASDLHKLSKRSIQLIKKISEEDISPKELDPTDPKAIVKRVDVNYPGIAYKQIDKLSTRFIEDMHLVCPHCLYGLPDKGEEFNPSKLAENKLTLTSGSEPMFYNLDAFGVSGNGVVLGNTSDSTIGKELPRTSAEVPPVKVRIEQRSNALFSITNLSASDINTSNRKLYTGQSTTLGPGGSFTVLHDFTYRVDGGVFIVHPKMAMSGSEIIFSKESKTSDEDFLERIRGEAFGYSTFKELDREDRAAIAQNLEEVQLVIQAFYMLADSNPNLKDVGQYMVSIGVDSKEVAKVHEIVSNSLKVIVENPKRENILKFIVEKLSRELITKMELVAPGIKEYDKNVESYMKVMDSIIRDLRLTKLAEERIEGYDVETSESRQKLEERMSVRIGMVPVIPKGAIRQSAPLRAYLTKVEDAFVEVNKNIILTKRFDLMDRFVPNPEISTIEEGEFLNKHLVQDNASLIALDVLRRRLLDIPESIVKESTISMDPLSVRERKDVRYQSSNLPQIIKSLGSIFVMRDAESEEIGEESTFAQILCEEAGSIFIEQMKVNPQLFKTKLLDNKTGKLKNLSRFDSFEGSFRVIDAYSKNYYVVRVLRNNYVTNIESIVKDGQDIYVGNENKIFAKGGNIYIHKDIPVKVDEKLIIKGYYVTKTFYEGAIKPIIGQMSANIFGANFNYSIHSPKIGKEYIIHPIIYKTGLDRKLEEIEELKNSRENESKLETALINYESSKKAYSAVITSLREVVENKAQEWQLPESIISGRKFDYRLAVGRIPQEKEKMFWETLTKYIVEFPQNIKLILQYDGPASSREKKHIYRKRKNPAPIKINIEDLMFEVFGVRVKTAPQSRN